eukprot:scaffold596_cov236-Pinguiococcus_pyrenoidosus.AAC.9
MKLNSEYVVSASPLLRLRQLLMMGCRLAVMSSRMKGSKLSVFDRNGAVRSSASRRQAMLHRGCRGPVPSWPWAAVLRSPDSIPLGPIAGLVGTRPADQPEKHSSRHATGLHSPRLEPSHSPGSTPAAACSKRPAEPNQSTHFVHSGESSEVKPLGVDGTLYSKLRAAIGAFEVRVAIFGAPMSSS